MKREIKGSLVLLVLFILSGVLGWFLGSRVGGKEMLACAFSFVAGVGLAWRCRTIAEQKRQRALRGNWEEVNEFAYWLCMRHVSWRLATLPPVYLLNLLIFKSSVAGVIGVAVMALMWLLTLRGVIQAFQSHRYWGQTLPPPK